MSPFPLGLDPPGARVTTSTAADRDPCRLLAIIAEHHCRGAARYRRRDVTGDGAPETWCNVFAQDVAEAMGVLLPRHARANGLVEWLASPAARELGWEEVPTAHVARAQADAGQLALVAWHSRGAGSGHIAVAVPSLGEPGLWIAQAGLVNFTRGSLASGFGSRAVSYFTHP